MHLYPCARVNNCYSCHRADARRAIKLIFCCCNATRGEQIHNSVFSKFSESMYIPQYMLFFFIYLKFMWNRNVSFSARVHMLTRAEYGIWILCCLFVYPKREFGFKIAVTAGLQDITQENPL